MQELDPLVGEWSVEMVMPDADPTGEDMGARTTFEWMEEKRFLIQRWTVPVPEAPDGIALIGFDEGLKTLLQHYFDTRGVARVYEMGFAAGVWELERVKEDFSPLDFTQRFRGELTEDGKTIEGRWEINEEGDWRHDFDLIYRKVS